MGWNLCFVAYKLCKLEQIDYHPRITEVNWSCGNLIKYRMHKMLIVGRLSPFIHSGSNSFPRTFLFLAHFKVKLF